MCIFIIYIILRIILTFFILSQGKNDLKNAPEILKYAIKNQKPAKCHNIFLLLE